MGGARTGCASCWGPEGGWTLSSSVSLLMSNGSTGAQHGDLSRERWRENTVIRLSLSSPGFSFQLLFGHGQDLSELGLSALRARGRRPTSSHQGTEAPTVATPLSCTGGRLELRSPARAGSALGRFSRSVLRPARTSGGTTPASRADSLSLTKNSSLLSPPRFSIPNLHVHTAHFYVALLDCEL